MKASPARIFLILCVATALLVGAYLLYAKHRVDESAQSGAHALDAQAAPAPSIPPVSASLPTTGAEQSTTSISAPATHTGETAPAAAQVIPAPSSGRIYFRYAGVDAHYGQVAWTDSAKPGTKHFAETLNCEVVYSAGGRGICLKADRGVFTTYAASLFDARTFAVSSTFPLKGIPSRARISIDGSIAAFTVFVSGHGYSTLDFSTQTLLVDAKTGVTLTDLEDFEVLRDGAVIKAADFNFWGVTFTPDAKEFFATLSSAGSHLLVHGDIAARRMNVIHENVECPSLSPDAKRIAYKKRLLIDNRISWQLQVLELASGKETALSERRSIDDQLEWLDDRNVLYSVPSSVDDSSPSTDVWIAPIDAARAPRLYLKNAYSPAAARCKKPAACAAAG